MTLYSNFEYQRVRAQQVALAARLDAEWNAAFPVGTAVTVTRDNGTVEHIRTRSVAWQLPSGSPIVLLDGISGGYLLTRVKTVDRKYSNVLDPPSGGNQHNVKKIGKNLAMSKIDNYGVLRLTMADIRVGVSFEAATVSDVSGHRKAIQAARCVCLTSAEGERRIIGGRAECLRLNTRPDTEW